jgi:inosine/xanthosine triphosphatase
VGRDDCVSIIVASTNPVKVRAAAAGFREALRGRTIRAEGVAVPSPVASQPHGDEETLRGAEARAARAREARPDADYWVGIEGGVCDAQGATAAFAWIVVRAEDQVGRARTATFLLPEAVSELLRQGLELGEADDRVFGRTNSKQDAGAVGLLTRNVIDREALYAHAVVLALIPFLNRELFSSLGRGES